MNLAMKNLKKKLNKLNGKLNQLNDFIKTPLRGRPKQLFKP